MQLKWLGHSCFELAETKKVLIDPYISQYHAGDTALFGDMRLIGELYRPEVALLPIGGRYTMGIREAAIEQSPEKFSELVSSLCSSEVVILKPGESFELR